MKGASSLELNYSLIYTFVSVRVVVGRPCFLNYVKNGTYADEGVMAMLASGQIVFVVGQMEVLAQFLESVSGHHVENIWLVCLFIRPVI